MYDAAVMLTLQLVRSAMDDQRYASLKDLCVGILKRVSAVEVRLDDQGSKLDSFCSRFKKMSHDTSQHLAEISERSRAHLPSIESRILHNINSVLKDMFEGYTTYQTTLMEGKHSDLIALYSKVPDYYDSVQRLKDAMDKQKVAVNAQCRDVLGRLQAIQQDVQAHTAEFERRHETAMDDFKSRLSSLQDECMFLCSDLTRKQDDFVHKIEAQQTLLNRNVQDAVSAIKLGRITLTGKVTPQAFETSPNQLRCNTQGHGTFRGRSGSPGRTSSHCSVAYASDEITYQRVIRSMVEGAQLDVEKNRTKLFQRGLITTEFQDQAVGAAIRTRSHSCDVGNARAGLL